MLVVVGCICAIWVLVSSLIPRYWSFPIADKEHPDTIQLNGTVVHMSRISHWLFTGSFIAMLVGIVVLVGLGGLLSFGWHRGSSCAGGNDSTEHQ